MIKEIRRKYWAWRNVRWIRRHKQELYEKYDGHRVTVHRCKVIHVGGYSDKLPYSEWNGEVGYNVPVNLDKLAEKYGFVIGVHKLDE